MRFVSRGIRDRAVRHIGVTVDLGGIGIAVLCGRPEPSMGWMRENNDAPVCEDCLEEAANIASAYEAWRRA